MGDEYDVVVEISADDVKKAAEERDNRATEITRLREETAQLREALKVAADFLDDAYTDIGRDEYKVAGFVARAAIREGGKDGKI